MRKCIFRSNVRLVDFYIDDFVVTVQIFQESSKVTEYLILNIKFLSLNLKAIDFLRIFSLRDFVKG